MWEAPSPDPDLEVHSAACIHSAASARPAADPFSAIVQGTKLLIRPLQGSEPKDRALTTGTPFPHSTLLSAVRLQCSVNKLSHSRTELITWDWWVKQYLVDTDRSKMKCQIVMPQASAWAIKAHRGPRHTWIACKIILVSIPLCLPHYWYLR